MATCNSCGAQVPENVKFCTTCGAACGAPVRAAPAPPAYQAPPVQPAYRAPAYQAPVPSGPADIRPDENSIYAPIGTFGFVGYFILFAIPIIGQVLCIIWAFGKKGGNVNRRAFARATFIFLVVGLVFGIVGGVAAGAAIKNAANASGAAGLDGVLFSWAQGFGQKDDDKSDDMGGTEDAVDNWNNDNDNSGNNNGGAAQNGQDPAAYNFGEGTVFTAQWPDNEFTRQVPKPNFAVSVGSITDTEFAVLGSGATMENLRDYTKQLQRAGFNKNAETTDEAAFGMATYSYRADNNKGYQVEINYVSMMNINTITIRRLSNMS